MLSPLMSQPHMKMAEPKWLHLALLTVLTEQMGITRWGSRASVLHLNNVTADWASCREVTISESVGHEGRDSHAVSEWGLWVLIKRGKKRTKLEQKLVHAGKGSESVSRSQGSIDSNASLTPGIWKTRQTTNDRSAGKGWSRRRWSFGSMLTAGYTVVY